MCVCVCYILWIYTYILTFVRVLVVATLWSVLVSLEFKVAYTCSYM